MIGRHMFSHERVRDYLGSRKNPRCDIRIGYSTFIVDRDEEAGRVDAVPGEDFGRESHVAALGLAQLEQARNFLLAQHSDTYVLRTIGSIATIVARGARLPA